MKSSCIHILSANFCWRTLTVFLFCSLQIEYRRSWEYLIRLWNPWGKTEWRGRWSDRYGFWKPLSLLHGHLVFREHPGPRGQQVELPASLSSSHLCGTVHPSHTPMMPLTRHHLDTYCVLCTKYTAGWELWDKRQCLASSGYTRAVNSYTI